MILLLAQKGETICFLQYHGFLVLLGFSQTPRSSPWPLGGPSPPIIISLIFIHWVRHLRVALLLLTKTAVSGAAKWRNICSRSSQADSSSQVCNVAFPPAASFEQRNFESTSALNQVASLMMIRMELWPVTHQKYKPQDILKALFLTS